MQSCRRLRHALLLKEYFQNLELAEIKSLHKAQTIIAIIEIVSTVVPQHHAPTVADLGCPGIFVQAPGESSGGISNQPVGLENFLPPGGETNHRRNGR
jgi:hypothetical protein